MKHSRKGPVRTGSAVGRGNGDTMPHIRFIWLGAVIAAALCPPRGAAAQSQVFTERGAFAAVAGQSLSCVDFEDRADGEVFQELSIPGVVFHSADQDPEDLLVLGPESTPLAQVQS